MHHIAKKNRNRIRLGLIVVWGLMGAAFASGHALAQSAPQFGDSFWKTWGDGQAEVSAYDLTFPRYGSARKGLAVTIFVTETFDHATRVKTERSGPGTFPVMKLNLVQDFPTGVYDYNLMTSVFVALQEVDGLPAGAVTKTTFSAQEWCGHAFEQLIFDRDQVRHTGHSYFEGEADRQDSLPAHVDGLSEDAVLLWARGLAGPAVEPGKTRTVALLRSVQIARLEHIPVVWDRAELSRGAQLTTVTVPAGTFQVRTNTVTVIRSGSGKANHSPQVVWTFAVEAQPPHRVVRWSRSDGLLAELVAGQRMAYWKLNGPGLESMLTNLGLTPRPPRTP